MGGIFGSGRLAPLPLNWTIGPTLGTTQLTADKTVLVYKAPFACEVVDAGHCVTDTKISKSATNHALIKLLNAGADGTGTSVIATATVGKTADVNAGVPTALSFGTTVAWKKLDAGDYLAVQYDEQGTLALYNWHGCAHIVFGHEDY